MQYIIGDWPHGVLPFVRPDQRWWPVGHGRQPGHQVWHAAQEVLPWNFFLRIKVLNLIVLLNQMRRQNFVISSSRLNNILKSKLREYARSLRLAIDKGNTDNELRVQIAGMMAEVYRYVDQFILQTFNFFDNIIVSLSPFDSGFKTSSQRYFFAKSQIPNQICLFQRIRLLDSPAPVCLFFKSSSRLHF